MTGDTTLFAHIISMFTNQTERAATEALGYILAESETVRRGVEQLVRTVIDIRFSTSSVPRGTRGLPHGAYSGPVDPGALLPGTPSHRE